MSGRHERKERFVDACGVRLRAIVEGEGEPVLVLHGFTGDAESMESVVPPLLGKHCVVRLELIGHGGSDSPVARDAYAMNVCAEQISAAARALGLVLAMQGEFEASRSRLEQVYAAYDDTVHGTFAFRRGGF